jgi:hypothetical protein
MGQKLQRIPPERRNDFLEKILNEVRLIKKAEAGAAPPVTQP